MNKIEADRKILIVDDDPAFNELLVFAYGLEGKFKPLSASSGVEACKIIDQSCEEIDLVTLDICMSDMNGWAVLDYLKGKEKLSGRRASVLVISALPEDHEDLIRRKGQIDRYLVKPVDIVELMSLSQNLLAKSPKHSTP